MITIYASDRTPLSAARPLRLQPVNLHAGTPRVENGNWTRTTVKDLANQYLRNPLDRRHALELSVVYVPHGVAEEDFELVLRGLSG